MFEIVYLNCGVGWLIYNLDITIRSFIISETIIGLSIALLAV